MKKLILLLTILLIPIFAWSAPPTRSYVYTAGTSINPDKVTANEDNLFTYVQGGIDTIKDGTIVNADISSSAAISDSKLDTITTAGKVDTDALTGTFADLGTLLTGTLAVADGGTAATTAADARTNLGLGTVAVYDSPLPIANGGTASASTTYCDLTANVTGTLPVGNGGTGLTALTTFLLTTDTRMTVAYTTWDTTTTGTLAVTTGFTPTKVIFFYEDQGTKEFGIGLDDCSGGGGAGSMSLYMDATANTWDTQTTVYSIFDCENGATTHSKAYITSTNATSFTLTFSKTGSPTGTLNIICIAFK